MRPSSLLIAAAMSALATSCAVDTDSALHAVIKRQLKDPESAQFHSATYSSSGKQACMDWNARNGFGGYSDWVTTRLKKSATSWEIVETSSTCTSVKLDEHEALEAGELASTEAEKVALAALQKARKIDRDEALALVDSGGCRKLFVSFAFFARSVAENSIRPAPNTIDYQQKLAEARAILDSGLCDTY